MFLELELIHHPKMPGHDKISILIMIRKAYLHGWIASAFCVTV